MAKLEHALWMHDKGVESIAGMCVAGGTMRGWGAGTIGGGGVGEEFDPRPRTVACVAPCTMLGKCERFADHGTGGSWAEAGCE